MEELINKLIEKGWKPRGIYTGLIVGYGLVRCEEYVGSPNNERKSYRELVSKESGLWQFVCENDLIQTEHYNGERAKNVYYEVDEYDEEGDIIQTGDMEGDKFIGMYDYEYRLIESALCNEDSLEQFLLDNIKVDD